jgi:plastocyanin
MMDTKRIIYIFISCFVFLIAFSLLGCGSDSQDTSNLQVVSDTIETAPDQVICKDNRFIPDTLRVQTGTTVTWVNQDDFIHTVTSGSSPSDRSDLFDSGNLNEGQTFTYTFESAGTFDYFCIPHFSLGMTGKIIVTD